MLSPPLSIEVKLVSICPASGSPFRSVRGVFGEVDLELTVGGQHLDVRHKGSSSVPGSLGHPIAQS